MREHHFSKHAAPLELEPCRAAQTRPQTPRERAAVINAAGGESRVISAHRHDHREELPLKQETHL